MRTLLGDGDFKDVKDFSTENSTKAPVVNPRLTQFYRSKASRYKAGDPPGCISN